MRPVVPHCNAKTVICDSQRSLRREMYDSCTASGHSKRRDKPGCKNQTNEKLLDPSHFLGPTFGNPKRPFPATKSAFEVKKGTTDVSASQYERIVKFDKVCVTGVEVFVTSHKDLCTGALWSSATIKFLRSYERPFPIVWKIQTGFVRTVWSGITALL